MGSALYDINKGGHCIFIPDVHISFYLYMYCKCISNSLMTLHGTVFLTLNLVTEANDICSSIKAGIYAYFRQRQELLKL